MSGTVSEPTKVMHDYSHFTRNSRPTGAPLVRGEGTRVWDEEGIEYLDCCSQTLNLVLGQCHPEIGEAVIEQARRLTFASSRYATEATIRLVSAIVANVPQSLCRVNLRSTSGSSANEAAIKAARKRTGKRLIFSFIHSHHGQTTEVMRISGKHFEAPYLGDRGAVFLPQPQPGRDGSGELTLEELQELYEMQDGDVAALILEPVMVNAGVIPFSQAYLRRLREFCSRNDIALIFDEVQTGFGWLGTMHAMAHFEVTPDIVTFAKGLGAGYPVAATVLSEDYDVLDYGEHELTFGAHPVSCAAGVKMFEILSRPGFLEDVRRKGVHIADELERLTHAQDRIRRVRGLGFIWGIEFNIPGSPEPARVIEHLRECGLIFRTSNNQRDANVLVFKPPLIMSAAEISSAIHRLGSAIQSL